MVADLAYSHLINSDMQNFLSEQLGHRAWISNTKWLSYQASMPRKNERKFEIMVERES